MLPTLVLVGRPNVGKSTLFNRLTRSRDAIVADFPGLTRDRHYGRGRLGEQAFLVVDTGGFEPEVKGGILRAMAKQTAQAIAEADVVLFLTDAREGLTVQDRSVAETLRRGATPVILAVNKAEGMQESVVTAEFYELGLGEPHAISSAHGDGVRDLLELALQDIAPATSEHEDDGRPKIAVVGRPNVGKSTLVNTLLGEERVVTFDQPGTTRDSIYIDFERAGHPYTLIDTAGIRKRGKVFESIEKFSVVKTLQAIEDANVVLLVLDAQQEIAEQDAHIAGFVLETGKALVVAVNKWDGLERSLREAVKNDIARKLMFLHFAQFHYVCALDGSGLPALFPSIDIAYAAAMIKLSTPRLTRVLMEATARQQPPQNGPFRPKLRYAHQGGSNPPLVVVHGSAVRGVPETYRRYLENTFRTAFDLRGTPLRVDLKQGSNPFAGRKPQPLTESEQNQRRRQRRYSKRKYS